MARVTVPIVVNVDEIKKYLEQNDIVEVVRCKDCKHMKIETYPSGIQEMQCTILFEVDMDDPWCGSWLLPKPNDYCSYGEREGE